MPRSACGAHRPRLCIRPDRGWSGRYSKSDSDSARRRRANLAIAGLSFGCRVESVVYRSSARLDGTGGGMLTSRRRFVAASLSLAGAATARAYRQQNPNEPPPGAPPAFGTGPAVGPEVSNHTFSEAEKLVQVQWNGTERAEAARSWRKNMAFLYERRTGPRKVGLEATLAPATKWNPLLPGIKQRPTQNRFIRSNTDPGPLPSRDQDIAFAPVTRLSRWIEQRKLTSERLTNIYL